MDNIRICQPEHSDVHWNEAEVNFTFGGCLNLMLTEKECTYVLLYDKACLSFPNFKKRLHIYTFALVRCSLCTEEKII